MNRFLAVAATVLIALSLGGCAMQNESRLDEFLAESQRIANDTVALVPDEPRGEVIDRGAEPRFGDTQSAEQKPDDPAWGQARARVEYADPAAGGAAEAGAAAIAASLTRDGWTESRVRETDEGQRVTDGFRKDVDGDEWYVEVAWTKAAEGKVDSIDVLVVSPPTTRGDSTAVN